VIDCTISSRGQRWAAVRQRLSGAAVIVTLVAFTVFVGWLVRSCMDGRDIARRFVAAARERRVSAAYDLASPGLLAKLLGDTHEARTFALLQATRGDLGVVENGITGTRPEGPLTWPEVPFACFDGDLSPTETFWIVATKTPAGWRIVELRSDKAPAVCEGDDG
jgi:hypothetical protein